MNFLLIIATLAAFFVKGLCGFANTLVFDSILGLGYNNVNISPVELLITYPSSMILAWNKRKFIDVKVWLPLSLLVIVGMVPGSIFLKNGNPQIIKILFGFIVIAIALQMLLHEKFPVTKQSPRVVLILIGIFSGVLSGIFGIGAVLVAYISRTTTTSDSLKANICMVFIVENTIRTIVYIITGIITFSVALSAIKMFPFMIIGLNIGMKCSNKISEKSIKYIVIFTLFASGFTLLLLNFMA
ncbi:MAG: permease [Treponema sp. CETP13]|nr:MAG: permease [Treponema sp. CETP13]